MDFEFKFLFEQVKLYSPIDLQKFWNLYPESPK